MIGEDNALDAVFVGKHCIFNALDSLNDNWQICQPA